MQEIGGIIQQEVKSQQETIVVGNVRATYNNGRKTYDWQGYAYQNQLKPMPGHFKINIDWKKVCDDAELTDAPVLSQSEPSVTLKVKR
jgi:hypothetical protein